MNEISNTLDEIQFSVDELWSNMNKLSYATDETKKKGLLLLLLNKL